MFNLNFSLNFDSILQNLTEIEIISYNIHCRRQFQHSRVRKRALFRRSFSNFSFVLEKELILQLVLQYTISWLHLGASFICLNLVVTYLFSAKTIAIGKSDHIVYSNFHQVNFVWLVTHYSGIEQMSMVMALAVNSNILLFPRC